MSGTFSERAAIKAGISVGACSLFVDLDGTFVRTDLLVEGALLLLKRSPLALLPLPLWLIRGKAHLKEQVARRVSLDPVLLPYNEPFLEFLRREAKAGRRLVLATGTNVRFARAVAEHLKIFDDIVASDGQRNSTGKRKLEAILRQVSERGFAIRPALGSIWKFGHMLERQL